MMVCMSSSDTYHHGDLRNALLDAVGAIIDEKGVGAVSLREAARRAGVSHSAPGHHFGDKLGLLTAFAERGFELFGSGMQTALDEAGQGRPGFDAIGIEYLRFALEHRAYFEVMFRAELHDSTDPELHETSHGAFGVLMRAVDDMDLSAYENPDPLHLAIGAWATVHGLATLWLDGAISQFTDEDLFTVALNVFALQASSEE